MTSTQNTEATAHLFDADTADDLGPATPEQVEASDRAAERDGGRGIFGIDADGDPVARGGRSVYTA